MKTYFLISDVVLMGLIASCTSLLTIIFNAIINARVKRMEKLQAATKVQMDGHMTTLIETTAELNKELGNKEGRAERKAEQAPIVEQKLKEAEELGILKGKEEIRIEQKNGPPHENSHQ